MRLVEYFIGLFDQRTECLLVTMLDAGYTCIIRWVVFLGTAIAGPFGVVCSIS